MYPPNVLRQFLQEFHKYVMLYLIWFNTSRFNWQLFELFKLFDWSRFACVWIIFALKRKVKFGKTNIIYLHAIMNRSNFTVKIFRIFVIWVEGWKPNLSMNEIWEYILLYNFKLGQVFVSYLPTVIILQIAGFRL